MAQANQRDRIEMRVDPEIKQLAERASAALGCASMTEYITSLIRNDAPEVLRRQASIELTNSQFDNFIAVCDDTSRKPSKRILDAAKRLDEEGF